MTLHLTGPPFWLARHRVVAGGPAGERNRYAAGDSRDMHRTNERIEEPMLSGSQPLIVCLCGSTKRFMKTAFVDLNSEETLKGNIVVSVGVNMEDDARVQKMLDGKTDAEKAVLKERIKTQLDWLHRRKIDMADVVIVLKTAGDELGDSTRDEKEYAERKGKRVEVREFTAQAGSPS